MTTPQNPGEENTPQDPADPQNPYGTPPPPPQQPSAPQYGQPEYGQPTPPAQPQYGAPPPADPNQPPAYGQPQYGAPQPGVPAYGQAYPAYGAPGAPGAGGDAPKGMAITALILSILGCTGILAVVSIVLSVIVLRRGKDGRNHGRGLAIAAIIISIVSLLATVAIVVLVAVGVSNLTSVDDLTTGQCLTADGLADDGDSVTSIDTVGCSTAHDGEVLATVSLSADQASGYGDDTSNQLCSDAITSAGKIDLVADGVSVVGLTQSLSPDEGDKLACVAFNSDGSELTGKLGS